MQNDLTQSGKARDFTAELLAELEDPAAHAKREAAAAWGEAYTLAKQSGLTPKQCDKAADKAHAAVLASLSPAAPVQQPRVRATAAATPANNAGLLDMAGQLGKMMQTLETLHNAIADLAPLPLLVDDLTAELSEVRAELAVLQGKPADAAALGRNGGKARAARLTPEQRKESAQRAARARWESVAVDRQIAAGPLDVDSWADDPAEYIGLDAAYSRAMDMAAATGRVDCYAAAQGMEDVAHQLAGRLNSNGWEPDGGEIHGGLHFRYRCVDSGEVAQEVRSLAGLDLAHATPEHVSAVRHALFMRDQQQAGYGRAKSNDALRQVYINRQGGKA
jgi:hypothetical protein